MASWLVVVVVTSLAACGGEETVVKGPTLVEFDATADGGTLDDVAGDVAGDVADDVSADVADDVSADVTSVDAGGADTTVLPDTTGGDPDSADSAATLDTGDSPDMATGTDAGADTAGTDTGADTADTAGGCQQNSDCDAKIALQPCFVAICKASKCTVALSPAGSACDDGDKCTESDACTGGTCAGKTLDCDDGKPCTVDTCDATTGKCSWAAKSGPCSDGDLCTKGEACKAGDCVGGVALRRQERLHDGCVRCEDGYVQPRGEHGGLLRWQRLHHE